MGLIVNRVKGYKFVVFANFWPSTKFYSAVGHMKCTISKTMYIDWCHFLNPTILVVTNIRKIFTLENVVACGLASKLC